MIKEGSTFALLLRKNAVGWLLPEIVTLATKPLDQPFYEVAFFDLHKKIGFNPFFKGAKE